MISGLFFQTRSPHGAECQSPHRADDDDDVVSARAMNGTQAHWPNVLTFGQCAWVPVSLGTLSEQFCATLNRDQGSMAPTQR